MGTGCPEWGIRDYRGAVGRGGLPIFLCYYGYFWRLPLFFHSVAAHDENSGGIKVPSPSPWGICGCGGHGYGENSRDSISVMQETKVYMLFHTPTMERYKVPDICFTLEAAGYTIVEETNEGLVRFYCGNLILQQKGIRFLIFWAISESC